MLKNKVDRATLAKLIASNPTQEAARAELETILGISIKKSTFNDLVHKLLKRDIEGKTIKRNADMRLHRQRFMEEVKEDFKLQDIINKQYECIMCIPDLHTPYHHREALDFLKAVKDMYAPDLVVCLGDELDNHAMSFHDSDPDLDSAGSELIKGRKALHKLHEVFPNMLLCHSNHGSLAYRRAKKFGLPRHLLLTLRDVIFGERTPDGEITRSDGSGWHWADYFIINPNFGSKIKFKHGGSSSDVMQDLSKERINLVRGHYHSQFNIAYSASPEAQLWGMTCGCLIDNKALSFEYNKVFNETPVYGCGVIVNGQPLLVPMITDGDGKWIGKLV